MIVRFHGHACFELEAADGTRLCVDPYEAGGFGGAVALPRLPDHFHAWVATHAHPDHDAGHEIPAATRVHVDALRPGTSPRPGAPGETSFGPFRIEALRAFHDEFAGLLRSGTTDLLRVTADGTTFVHVGDLGERLVGPALDWLAAVPIDALAVPVGGYFTLGPDGAAELTALLRPRFALPCHASDDGVELAPLGDRARFVERFSRTESRRELDLSQPRDHDRTSVVLLSRERAGR